MCSLINKQLLLTAYAYLFIMEEQKAQQGSEALQLQMDTIEQMEVSHQDLRLALETALEEETKFLDELKKNSKVFESARAAVKGDAGYNWTRRQIKGVLKRSGCSREVLLNSEKVLGRDEKFSKVSLEGFLLTALAGGDKTVLNALKEALKKIEEKNYTRQEVENLFPSLGSAKLRGLLNKVLVRATVAKIFSESGDKKKDLEKRLAKEWVNLKAKQLTASDGRELASLWLERVAAERVDGLFKKSYSAPRWMREAEELKQQFENLTLNKKEIHLAGLIQRLTQGIEQKQEERRNRWNEATRREKKQILDDEMIVAKGLGLPSEDKEFKDLILGAGTKGLPQQSWDFVKTQWNEKKVVAKYEAGTADGCATCQVPAAPTSVFAEKDDSESENKIESGTVVWAVAEPCAVEVKNGGKKPRVAVIFGVSEALKHGFITLHDGMMPLGETAVSQWKRQFPGDDVGCQVFAKAGGAGNSDYYKPIAN